MLCAIGLDAAACRYIVLQTWLGKQTDVRREIVLHTESCSDRPLKWSMECGLVAEFHRAVDIIACVKRRIDRYLHLRIKTSVEIPLSYIIYIICTLQRYTEVMDGLLLMIAFPLEPILASDFRRL